MNTHVVVDAIAEFAAGKRPVASELYITNADGVSVRYAMITAERNKKRRKNTKSAGTDLRLEGVVQILVFQAYMVSLYLHFIAFDFLYVVEFSRSRI